MLILFLLALLWSTSAVAQPTGTGYAILYSPEQVQIACQADEILKAAQEGVWACAQDNSSAGSGAILDLGDDANNESPGITEIATLGDANNIFSEPSANKLLITLNNDWPKCTLADALAANGGNCAEGEAPLGVDASGAAESCFAVLSQAVLDAHIADMTDVHGLNIAAPVDGHLLLYDGITDTRFENVAMSGDAAITAAGVVTVANDSHSHVVANLSNVGGGSDLTADLEEETHAAEHAENAADELFVENLGTGCSDGELVRASAGGMACGSVHAGSDITADLEEEAHASEHAENAADELLVENLGTACTDGQVVVASSGGMACGNASTGDVTDVFNCASGDCNNVVLADGDLLNMNSVTVSTTSEGLILPKNAGDCSAGTAEGQVCWDSTNDALYVGDGTAAQKQSIKGTVHSAFVPAGMMYVENSGLKCYDEFDKQYNSAFEKSMIVCGDDDNAKVWFTIPTPPAWNASGLTLTGYWINEYAGDNGNTYEMDWSAYCVSAGDKLYPASETFGSEVAMTFTTTTGANDTYQVTTAKLTPAGTCAKGDMIRFQGAVDAAATTVSNAFIYDLLWIRVNLTYDAWGN